MRPSYPVFVADSGGDVGRVHSEAGLNYYEQVDIEDHEYTCWDRNALPCEMTWDDATGVGLRVLERPAEPEQLLDAVRKHARLWRVELASDMSDPTQIMERVEAEQKSRSFWSRIRRLFSRRSA